ncbi:hypothetical protein DMN77_08235 [Paenibacillus sp. 79R4]|uniref:hypothetical protein n=1 Tax=Paenibacillus sp. 79R4 TaxID=2212847 RepID=UPI0015B9086A|nr:hypothetical protein [Paenibacillus sp. 79R4]NWL87591.1 hypothetical protein [Paenibacillus sp. 79R4]
MSDKDPFESIRRMNETVRRAMLPAIQFQKQISTLNVPEMTQMIKLEESIRLMLKNMNDDYMRAIEAAVQTPKYNFELIKPTIESLSQLKNFTIPVPDVIIPKVTDLCKSLEPLLEDEEEIEDSSPTINITINNYVNETSSWTWPVIISLIFTILQLLQPIYQTHLDDVKNRKDSIVQDSRHEELIEKFNELINAIPPAISEHNHEEELPSPHSPE